MEYLENKNEPEKKRNEKIRLCPCCKQEVKVNIGLHNWKNLFRKPTMDEMITLFIIVCVIALYFVYQHDIGQYQQYISKNCNNLPSGLYLNNKINTSAGNNLVINNSTT